ncbi:hypothetical protein TOPH_00841, partial [Tolypocladium ophioglossoides CBS 100239]
MLVDLGECREEVVQRRLAHCGDGARVSGICSQYSNEKASEAANLQVLQLAWPLLGVAAAFSGMVPLSSRRAGARAGAPAMLRSEPAGPWHRRRAHAEQPFERPFEQPLEQHPEQPLEQHFQQPGAANLAGGRPQT